MKYETTTVNGYKVHVCRVTLSDYLDVVLPSNPLNERSLADINHPSKTVLAKTNCGIFTMGIGTSSTSVQDYHRGAFYAQGTWKNKARDDYHTLLCYNNGKSTILDNPSRVNEILSDNIASIPRNSVRFAIGVPLVLIKNDVLTDVKKEPLYNHFGGNKTMRTMLGIKLNGEAILVVAEGGFNAQDCQDYMRNFGLNNAVMLDGGGSSQMIVDGSWKYMNGGRKITSIVTICTK